MRQKAWNKQYIIHPQAPAVRSVLASFFYPKGRDPLQTRLIWKIVVLPQKVRMKNNTSPNFECHSVTVYMTPTKAFRNRESLVAGQMGKEVNGSDVFPDSVGRKQSSYSDRVHEDFVLWRLHWEQFQRDVKFYLCGYKGKAMWMQWIPRKVDWARSKENTEEPWVRKAEAWGDTGHEKYPPGPINASATRVGEAVNDRAPLWITQLIVFTCPSLRCVLKGSRFWISGRKFCHSQGSSCPTAVRC